jgi:hypothetical protein
MARWIVGNLGPLSYVRASFVCCCGVTISVVECGFCDFVIVVCECDGTLLSLSVIKVL